MRQDTAFVCSASESSPPLRGSTSSTNMDSGTLSPIFHGVPCDHQPITVSTLSVKLSTP